MKAPVKKMVKELLKGVQVTKNLIIKHKDYECASEVRDIERQLQMMLKLSSPAKEVKNRSDGWEDIGKMMQDAKDQA